MNRSEYFNYIEKKLRFLSYHIEKRGKINLLDLNIYSETFFAGLINCIFGYHLENGNQIRQNIEGIDLIDEENKIVAQVSATCTKQKIEHSLEKELLGNYPDFRFVFLAIAGEADKLRESTFKNPHKLIFSPKRDIMDINSLVREILNLEISKQRKLYEFVRNELGSDIDIVKMDSNLATIIDILSRENLSNVFDMPEINSFEIFRKIEFNDLTSVQPTIDDYKIFYSRLDEKYKEFDKQGMNKSISVLSNIRSTYHRLSRKISNAEELFFAMIDQIIEVIRNSKNYVEIPYEELEMCVSILIVDAFIRCKIFRNPEGYHYAVTR